MDATLLKQGTRHYGPDGDMDGGLAYWVIKGRIPDEADWLDYTDVINVLPNTHRGPGTFFADEPYIKRRGNSRSVIAQRFGYDI